MKKILLAALTFLVTSVCLSAQGGRDFQKEFDEFLGKNQREFAQFQKRNEKQFVKFLEYAWAWFEGKPAEKEPKLIVPQEVPPLPDDVDIPDEDFEVIIESVVEFKPLEIGPSPKVSPLKPRKASPKGATFTLYGNSFQLRCEPKVFPNPDISSNSAVAAAWKAVGNKDTESVLEDCSALRASAELGDWAYLTLVRQAAASVCTNEGNARVLLEAWLLMRSGLKVRLATDESLHYLVNFDCNVYHYPSWSVDDEKFYLLDGSPAERLKIMTEDYPGTRPVQLLDVQDGKFPVKLASERTYQSRKYPDICVTAKVDTSRMEYYQSYPVTYSGDNHYSKWIPYAMRSLNAEGFYERLLPLLKGLTAVEVVGRVLDLVQTGFVYQLDDKVWGRDRVFFPDETLYYPYCDCEDRAILFTRIIRDIVGLKTALIYYPGHLAAAVRFPEKIGGDYFELDGEKYTVCDPTYVGAPIGMSMNTVDKTKAVVIRIE